MEPLPRLFARSRAVRIGWMRRQYGDLCHLCGERMTFDRGQPTSATMDHLKPKSKGGGDHPSNFRLAHKLCNERRGNTPLPEGDR